jgi:hypothetical protein
MGIKARGIVESYRWCLHCERASGASAWRAGGCPTGGCDGSWPMDAWYWSEYRRGREDLVPAVPVLGALYPQYCNGHCRECKEGSRCLDGAIEPSNRVLPIACRLGPSYCL